MYNFKIPLYNNYAQRCAKEETAMENEKMAKHVALSMTKDQKARLHRMSKRLGMPASRIVNILIQLADDNQILEDLIKKISNYAWESTSEETHRNVQLFQKILYEGLDKFSDYLVYATERMMRDPDIQRKIEIAKYNWLEEAL